MRHVQLDPMTLSVRSTGQSAVSWVYSFDSNNSTESYLEIPGYLWTFGSAIRPLVAVIGLGLIRLGAARMRASAWLRYTTAVALSVWPLRREALTASRPRRKHSRRDRG
jgi:hypothetical protein